jgi:predicted metal-dependent hydrolase
LRGEEAAPPREPALSDEEIQGLVRGVEEFNQGYYFECHDTLEEVWSGIRGEARDFFQGLIQVAVGLYHWRNGNLGGALTMLERGLRRLDRYGESYAGVELGSLRLEVAEARRRVLAEEPFPEDHAGLPRFRLSVPPGE